MCFDGKDAFVWLLTGSVKSIVHMRMTVSAGIPPDYSRIILAARWCPFFSVLCGHNGRKPTAQGDPVQPGLPWYNWFVAR